MEISKGRWEVVGSEVVVKKTEKEAEANVHLIAEAGNVANETGLMPRELLKQRDDLLEVCVQTVLALKTGPSINKTGLLFQRLEHAIAETETK